MPPRHVVQDTADCVLQLEAAPANPCRLVYAHRLPESWLLRRSEHCPSRSEILGQVTPACAAPVNDGSEVPLANKQVSWDQVPVYESGGDRLVDNFESFRSKASNRFDVDEVGSVPLWIVQPPVQPLEQRAERPASTSGWARFDGYVDDFTDGRDRSRKVAGQRPQLSCSDPITARPGIGSVDPLKHGPTVREYLVGLADMAYQRGHHEIPETRLAELPQHR